jgi:hypothetical protein
VIIEEAAFVPPTVIKDIFVPLLIKDECCFVALSTLGYAPSNYFNRLLASGKFKVFEVSFICGPCREKGLIDEACRHRKDAVPHWNNIEKMALIKAMMMEEGESQFQRETLGINPADKTPEVYNPDHVKRFFNSKPVKLTEQIYYLLTSVDPVAGTDISDKRSSDFVIMTMAMPGNIIMGIDALDVTTPEDYESILVEHVRKIRSHPLALNAAFILDVESGTGTDAGNIRRVLKEAFGQKTVIAMSNQRRRPGSLTTEVTKAEGVRLVQEHLRKGELRMWDQLVTSHEDPKALIHGDFQTQLFNFRRVVTERKNGINSVRYTGKLTKTTKDDLAMTLMLLLLASQEFFRNIKLYGEYHKGGYR